VTPADGQKRTTNPVLRYRPPSRRAPNGVGAADQRKHLVKFRRARPDIDGHSSGEECDEGFITATMNPSWWQ
jgi:hypothetical protein